MGKIIINGRFLIHRITGVERYARELVSALDRISSPDEIEMAVPPETEDIPEYKNIRVYRVGRLHDRLWEHVSFPSYVRKKNATALNLCNVAPLSRPDIVAVHDIKPVVHPEYYNRRFVLWYRILYRNEFSRAKYIITGTHFSAREIAAHYHVDPRRIVFVPEGREHFERISYDENALDRYGLKAGEFYFSMGSLEPGKNLKWVLRTAQLDPANIYAIAGNINTIVFSEENTERVPNNVCFLGYVSDEEAKTLMRDCRAFLFPTFYEGFGMPPLEALSSGCQCIAVSDIPVMHEIFEDQAVYIDPFCPGQIDYKQISNPEAVLCKYSWGKSAKHLQMLLQAEEHSRE